MVDNTKIAQLNSQIYQMQNKLAETLEGLVGMRDARADMLRVVIPIMQEQMAVISAMAELLP